MIENNLAAGTDDGRQAALAVYQKGAHSKSYAHVTLDTALVSDVSGGVTVVGKNANGDEIRGKVMSSAAAGETKLMVQYDTTIFQASYVGCQVGGSPEPVTDGCKSFLRLFICSPSLGFPFLTCLLAWSKTFCLNYRLPAHWIHDRWCLRRPQLFLHCRV